MKNTGLLGGGQESLSLKSGQQLAKPHCILLAACACAPNAVFRQYGNRSLM